MWRSLVGQEVLAFFIRFIHRINEVVKGFEVALLARLECFFNLVVSGYHLWVHRAHLGDGRFPVLLFLFESILPSGMPVLKVFGGIEFA